MKLEANYDHVSIGENTESENTKFNNILFKDHYVYKINIPE